MEEAHKAQIKVYMQRVRHLEYEFTNQAKKVKNDATKFMKEEKAEHTKNDQTMLKEKKTEKDNFVREEYAHHTEIISTVNKLDQDF